VFFYMSCLHGFFFKHGLDRDGQKRKMIAPRDTKNLPARVTAVG
jgi:hypothetical protein